MVLLLIWIWLLSTYALMRGREYELKGFVLIIMIIIAPFLMVYWVFDWLMELTNNRDEWITWPDDLKGLCLRSLRSKNYALYIMNYELNNAARAMTNVSKISLTLSLWNVHEDTFAQQIARFSCVCPCLIVSLHRDANDLPHLVPQTYWIKKDVNLTVMVPENRQYSSTPRNSQMHVRGIARAVSSVWCTGHLAVPQDYRCKRSVYSLCPLRTWIYNQ